MDQKHSGLDILYIGNSLTRHGYNPTTIDLLSARLRERYNVICASDERNAGKRLFDMLFSIWRNRRKVSIVLIDTYSTHAFYFAFLSGLLCQMLGLRYVPILHGGDLKKRLKRSKIMCNVFFKRSWENVSPSLYLTDVFRTHGFKVVYIPNFIPIEEYPFKQRDHLRPRLLYVRSFHAIYNPLLAVEVLCILLTRYPQASLCMVGPDKDGSLAQVKQRVRELAIEDHIQFTGRLPKHEWHTLSDQFDIFINTTQADNMPVSVVEAMALGLPVVSTNVGGLPYLILDGVDGMLVDANDAEAFVGKIIRLIENPNEASALSMRGRTKAESFAWENVRVHWDHVLNRTRESERL